MKSAHLVLATGLLASFISPVFADDANKPNAGTKKGAAVGAAAGHEVGNGHAVAGAATGAAVGHHEEKKSESK
jgi:outer membrane lipoprotein SlyB